MRTVRRHTTILAYQLFLRHIHRRILRIFRRGKFPLHSMVPTETDFARAVERPRDVVQDFYGS